MVVFSCIKNILHALLATLVFSHKALFLFS